MVPTRREMIAVSAGTALAGLGGCLGRVGYSPADDGTESPTRAECSATAPPTPDTGEGLPDPRSYPEGPPEVTHADVASFVEAYERAYKYNAMLAAFEADGNCVKYLELYAIGDETTVAETDGRFDVEVTTRGSYTGTACPAETATDTPTSLPHVDLPNMTVQYVISGRALVRDRVEHECW